MAMFDFFCQKIRQDSEHYLTSRCGLLGGLLALYLAQLILKGVVHCFPMAKVLVGVSALVPWLS